MGRKRKVISTDEVSPAAESTKAEPVAVTSEKNTKKENRIKLSQAELRERQEKVKAILQNMCKDRVTSKSMNENANLLNKISFKKRKSIHERLEQVKRNQNLKNK